MGMYQMFLVATARTRPGKIGAAADWWRETGQKFFESLPGVKSLRAFTSQFGIGDVYGIEFWYEIENYAVMDRWDEVISAEAKKYGEIFQQFDELYESGPSRLVGSWPESRLTE
jgi:hypothetical protein